MHKLGALTWILEHKTIPCVLHKVTFGSILILLDVSNHTTKQPKREVIFILFCNSPVQEEIRVKLNVGGKIFGGLATNHQIHQRFLPLVF